MLDWFWLYTYYPVVEARKISDMTQCIRVPLWLFCARKKYLKCRFLRTITRKKPGMWNGCDQLVPGWLMSPRWFERFNLSPLVELYLVRALENLQHADDTVICIKKWSLLCNQLENASLRAWWCLASKLIFNMEIFLSSISEFLWLMSHFRTATVTSTFLLQNA
jgi:hypothetical protein